MSNIKYIIFDFDGTIADTIDLALNIYNRIAPEYNCIPVKEENRGILRAKKPQDLLKEYGMTYPELILILFRISKEIISLIPDLCDYLGTIEGDIARPMVQKMRQIISHLIEIGVGYLSLNRSVATLSGGESQRVKMARQLDCDLVDMKYIMDEPSIGLHPKDISKLIEMLFRLKEKGNSVYVVKLLQVTVLTALHSSNYPKCDIWHIGNCDNLVRNSVQEIWGEGILH